MDAGQDLDQRRFAGAVLTDQGDNLAGVGLQAHIGQGPHAAEALADSVQSQDRVHAA